MEPEKRGPGRPPLRHDEDKAAETPQERAARRVAELQGHDIGNGNDGTDKYYINPGIIPPDWVYEWKRHTVYNQPDPGYQVALANDGWEPVDASRHPELMPVGYKGAILRDGCMLMERPKVITERVRAKQHDEARKQVRGKEAELAGVSPGQFERTLAKVTKTMETVAIPD